MKLLSASLIVTIALTLSACAENPAQALQRHLAAGDGYAASGKVAEAIVEYRAAIQVDPRAVEARRKLAEIFVQKNELSAALEHYVRAADLAPADAGLQVSAGELLLLTGAFEDARSRVEPVLKNDPANVRALLVRANGMAGLKDLKGAITEIEQAVRLEPGRSDAYSSLGLFRFVTGDQAGAEKEFQAAVAAAPRSPDPLLALAHFYFATNRTELGATQLRKVLDLESRNLIANRMMALIAIGSGKALDAEPYLKIVGDATGSNDDRSQLAQYYAGLGKHAEAASVLESLATAPGGFVPAQVQLAALELEQKHGHEAMKHVQDALAREPESALALAMKARLHLSANERALAASTLDAALRAHPEDVELHFLMAQVQAGRADWDAAADSLHTVLKRNPRALSAQLLLSRVELARLNPDAARQAADAVLSVLPGNPDASAAVVRSRLLKGDLAGAEQELARMGRLPPTTELESLRATVRLAKNDHAGARAAYERSLTLDPHNLEATAGLIQVAVAEGRTKDAVVLAERAVATSPNSPAIQVLAGKTYLRVRDIGRAEAALRKAIDLDPNTLEAYGLLGGLFVLLNRLDDARTEFERLVVQRPNSVAAHTFLGTVLEAQKRPADAEREYQRAFDIDQSAAVAANNLAWMYADGNRNLDSAMTLAEAAKRTLPNDAHVADTLGWVYYKKRLFTQAIRAFEESVARDPNSPGRHYRLGLSYLETSEFDKARTHLKQALKLDPNFPAAAEAKKALASLPG